MYCLNLLHCNDLFCRKCCHKKTKINYAVKIVTRRIDCSSEIQLLKICQGHPNIVQLVEDYCDEVSIARAWFDFQIMIYRQTFTANRITLFLTDKTVFTSYILLVDKAM